MAKQFPGKELDPSSSLGVGTKGIFVYNINNTENHYEIHFDNLHNFSRNIRTIA